MPGIDENRQFVPLKIAVLTVSDTRELGDDKSGNTLVERIRAAGHVLAERSIVKDDVKAIRQHVAGGADALDQRVAGLVVGELAGVGHREHRHLERHELSAFVDAGHFCVLKAAQR